MTDEEKRKLLLQDLCPRLPYGVKVEKESKIDELSTFDLEILRLGNWCDKEVPDCDNDKVLAMKKYHCKPYLRSLYSMTEKEDEERKKLGILLAEDKNGKTIFDGFSNISAEDTISGFDWLNQHHFDYRNLISLGLALEAPKDMYEL